MRRLLAVLGFALLLPATSHAGTFSFTPTPEQDQALAWHIQDRAGIAGSGVKRGGITPQAYLDALVTAHLNALVTRHRNATIGEKLRPTWDAKTPAERAAACAALGISPCPAAKVNR